MNETNEETTRRPLPEGWQWVRLVDVCRIVGGSTPSSTVPDNWNGDIMWVTPTDLGQLKSPNITTSIKKITEIGYNSCGTEIVPVGSIIMSSRAPIGYLGIASVPLCTNQGCKTFVPGADVDSSFLYFALRQSMSAIQRMGSGATFAEVSKSQLQSFEIPLPPTLVEQQRIGAVLRERLAAVEQARAAAAAQLAAAAALPAAYLRAVFASDEAAAWPRVRLGDAAEIASGITLGRKLNGEETQLVPYLRVANVKDGYLDLSDVYQIQVTSTEAKKWRLRYGDILLTEGGDADKLGRGTFWQEQIPDCIHQNHIFRVRFDLTKVSPQFISAQIGSTYGKAYFLAHAKQTTGIATINQQVLSNFPLMVPDIERQREVVIPIS